MSNKNKVRLSESQLNRVIKESVKRVLREGRYLPDGYDDEVDAELSKHSNPRNVYFNDEVTWFDPYSSEIAHLRSDYPEEPLRYDDEKGRPFANWKDGGDYNHYDYYGNKLLSPDDLTNPRYNDSSVSNHYRDERPFTHDYSGINAEAWAKYGEVPNYNGNGMSYSKPQSPSERNRANYQRSLKSADKRPLHRKGSANREF